MATTVLGQMQTDVYTFFWKVFHASTHKMAENNYRHLFSRKIEKIYYAVSK